MVRELILLINLMQYKDIVIILKVKEYWETFLQEMFNSNLIGK